MEMSRRVAWTYREWPPLSEYFCWRLYQPHQAVPRLPCPPPQPPHTPISSAPPCHHPHVSLPSPETSAVTRAFPSSPVCSHHHPNIPLITTSHPSPPPHPRGRHQPHIAHRRCRRHHSQIPPNHKTSLTHKIPTIIIVEKLAFSGIIPRRKKSFFHEDFGVPKPLQFSLKIVLRERFA